MPQRFSRYIILFEHIRRIGFNIINLQIVEVNLIIDDNITEFEFPFGKYVKPKYIFHKL